MNIKPAIILILIAALISCTESTAIKDYRDLPTEGWRAKDTLTFQVDTIRRAAPYEVILGIRTSSAHAYPFQKLTIVAEQQWTAKNGTTMRCHKDTLEISITNEKGDAQGTGISNYEHIIPLNQLNLEPGNQGRIRIYHLMRRPTLPGITNVGLELSPF